MAVAAKVSRYSAVLFDLDGTLVDSLPGIAWAAQEALTVVRPGALLPPLRPFVGPPIKEIFRRSLNEQSPEVLTALETAFRPRYNGEGWRRTVPFPEVSETLRDLYAEGWPLGVVTNKPLIPTQQILELLGFRELMSVVVTPDTVTPSYPNKAAALASLRGDTRFPPATTVFVGDSQDDAHAAAECGCPFVRAAFGYGSAPDAGLPPLQHFSTLREILGRRLST